jgi:hypothetical protein
MVSLFLIQSHQIFTKLVRVSIESAHDKIVINSEIGFWGWIASLILGGANVSLRPHNGSYAGVICKF